MPARRRGFAALLIAVAIVAAACSGDDDSSSKEAGSNCRPRGSERPAKAVLRCTEAAVAFVETEVASGTGVVVAFDDKRYILTNQHVVDPFDAADVTIGGKAHDEVPVLGVDIESDIALLGPLSGSNLPDPLPIGDGTELERGDDVFLVGFPGESEADELEATISSGIVSRLRQVKEFGQSYIQTDASISGGQSGGPLFDEAANLVGISGLSFAEEFALALTGKNVRAATTRILDGKGDEYLSVPPVVRPGAGATSGTVKLHDANDGQVLFLPAADEDRTWHLTVDNAVRPVVVVESPNAEEPMALSNHFADLQGQLARELAGARGGRPDDLPDPAAAGNDPKLAERETTPGNFTIPVKADESALVTIVALLTDTPVEVAWKSDLSLVPASRPVEETTMAVGDRIDRTVGGFDTTVDVLLDLPAGKKVQFHARSPQGDPGFMVYTPEQKLDHLTVNDPEGAGVETFDDTDDGLYGIDAKTTFTAETAGVHRVRIYVNDGSTVRVRFSVEDCAKVRCDDKKADKADKDE